MRLPTATELIEAKLSDTALLAMARKAKESTEAGERAVFSAKLKSLGHDPDVIIARGNSSSRSSERVRQSNSQSSGRVTPAWAWAGHSGGIAPSHSIYRSDYTDLNHIKKTMWEKSGKSKEEHNVMQYDGSFFRNSFTTFGHEGIHKDMADAMLVWGKSGNPYQTKAVFSSVRGGPRRLKLLWANGQHVSDKDHTIDHDSFNENPANDQQFMRGLNDWIDSKVPIK